MLSGCRLTLSLDVEMDVDGASVVELVVHADDALTAAIDVDELDVDDLDDGGWMVTGPEATSDGGTQLVLRTEDLSPEQLADAVAQLDRGRLFDVRRAEAVAAVGVTDYALEIDALVDAVADDFSDDELRAVLDGRSFGTDRVEMERIAGTTLEEAVVLEVRVAVPGGATPVEGSATVDLADETAATASASSQIHDTRVELARAEAELARADVDDSWQRLARFWGAAAVLAVVLLVVARLWRGRREVQEPTI